MANSTTNLDLISSSQASKEVTANALFDAASPAILFGRRASTTAALTWGYYGGTIMVDGVLTAIANGTVALSASTTNYIEATRAGVVSKNTTGFTPGSTPLYSVVTGASTITSYTDYRLTNPQRTGKLVLAMADANQTLTCAQAMNDILELTGALTALRDVVVPLPVQQWIVFANTSGGFGVQIIGATGTGITIADGKRAIVYSDGTDIVRATADV
jgi:hypothetical protein